MSENRYGVDTSYFYDIFERELKDISNHTPAELARVLARMSRTADEKVMHESEFARDLIEANKNEFINGVAATLGYILNNGEAIPEEELQRIGGIVLETRDVFVYDINDKGHKVAYELLEEVGKKAGVQSGDVAGLLDWIDKLPDHKGE